MFEPTALGRWIIQCLLISSIGIINYLSLRWIRKEVTEIKEEVIEYVDLVKTQTGNNAFLILSPSEFPTVAQPVTIPVPQSK